LAAEFPFANSILLWQRNSPLPTEFLFTHKNNHLLLKIRKHDRSTKGKEYQNSGTSCKDKEEKEG